LQAEKIVGGQLKVFFSANSAGNARLGIIASRKNFSRAADRNKIKRLIREAFRHHTVKTCPVDIVVLVGKMYFEGNKVSIVKLAVLFDQIKCVSS
jgi:ribonuclease P protein component